MLIMTVHPVLVPTLPSHGLSPLAGTSSPQILHFSLWPHPHCTSLTTQPQAPGGYLNHHLYDAFKRPALLTFPPIWSLDPNPKLVKPGGSKPDHLRERGWNPGRTQTQRMPSVGAPQLLPRRRWMGAVALPSKCSREATFSCEAV